MARKERQYKGNVYIRDELLHPYYISIPRGDTISYTLMREESRHAVGYYSNLHSVLRAALEYKVINELFKEEQELKLETYISTLQSAYDSLGHIMDKVLKKYSEIENDIEDE